MYIVAHETDDGVIWYYIGKKHGENRFTSGVGATKDAIKYKTFSRAKRMLKELETFPGGKKARLFIMPKSVYMAYEEWADRRAAQLRKEIGFATIAVRNGSRAKNRRIERFENSVLP